MYWFSHCKYYLALLGAKVVASCCDIEVSSLGNLGSLGASRTRHAPRPFKSARLRSLAWGPEAWHRSGRRWMKGPICRLSTSNRRNLLETSWNHMNHICIWKIWKFILNDIDNDIQWHTHWLWYFFIQFATEFGMFFRCAHWGWIPNASETTASRPRGVASPKAATGDATGGTDGNWW